jgi:hypothetical protein
MHDEVKIGWAGLTAMDDAMDIIEICQAFEHSQGDLADDVDIDGANLFVDTVEGALVHGLHADADVGVGDESAVEGDDILAVAVVHDV